MKNIKITNQNKFLWIILNFISHKFSYIYLITILKI